MRAIIKRMKTYHLEELKQANSSADIAFHREAAEAMNKILLEFEAERSHEQIGEISKGFGR